MDKILFIVKIITIVELVLLFFLIIFAYVMRVAIHFKKLYSVHVTKTINKELRAVLTEKMDLSKKIIKHFNRHLSLVLIALARLEKQAKKFAHWETTIELLSDNMFKPQARKYALSNNWFKRYLATLCYMYGFDAEDEGLLKKLIADENLLIALNAGRAVVKFPNMKLIDVLVQTFSIGRKIRQSVDAEILTKASQNFSPMLLQILRSTKDPYAKIFCYRMLTHLPHAKRIPGAVRNDLKSGNIELKLAALNYLATIKSHSVNALIAKFIKDSHWEVRAGGAKLLGALGHQSSIPLLTTSLKDREWWVRINSAAALMELGKNGIAVLEEQSPEVDKFAHETAQEVLRTTHLNQKSYHA